MKINVINSRVYGNPYQKLLYAAIGSRYQIASGTLSKAIRQQLLTKRSVYHIHWEESFFAKCRSVAQAVRVRREFIEALGQYVSFGGKVVWTLHNIRPHEGRFTQTFLSLRKDLAVLSHRILVHNRSALTILQEQTGLSDLSKVTVLPHPAYFDIYEPADKTMILAGAPPANPRTLLYFGLIRAYKGIPSLVRKLPREFMVSQKLSLHICGQPLRADSFLADLLEQSRNRPEIKYSLDTVPTDEVADLLRSNAGLVIPYHNVLTSGVTVLALTLGVPTIAPNTSAMRELFPESSHHLLFNPRSPKDFRRAVLALVNMPIETRQKIARDYIGQALSYHPQEISNTLGEIYDGLLGFTDSSEPLGPRCFWPQGLDDVIMGPRAYSQFHFFLENGPEATCGPNAASTTLSNAQLALELVRATLIGNVRAGISDELISNGVKDANKLATERAKLDGVYAVQLYADILGRLDLHSKDEG